MEEERNFTELINFIHPSLVDLDFQKSSTKAGITIGSLLTFFAIYLVSKTISLRTRSYRELSPQQKLFWNTSGVRAVFGVFAGVVGAWSIWNQTPLDQDVVFGKTKTSYFAICVTAGFFAFECVASLFLPNRLEFRIILLNLHHWLALMDYILVMYFDRGHSFVTKLLLTEMTTPLSAVSWMLLKCKKERTWLWKANHFLLVHLFHCRSLVESHLLYLVFRNWFLVWTTMPAIMSLSLFTQTPLVAFVMTPYWTLKKTRQMFNQMDWNFEPPNHKKNKEL